jgi:mannose-6-phosphate isomerase-like protein (cupin superfamily)
MHYTSSKAAQEHEWRGITIRELTPPGAPWHGSLVEVDVPPGITHPEVRSTLCETYYYCCEGGTLQFRVGEREITLSGGDLIVIEPGEWFSYRNPAAQAARLLSFNVPPYAAEATELGEDDPATGAATAQAEDVA